MRLTTISNWYMYIFLLIFLTFALPAQEIKVIHELNQDLERWQGRTVEITGYLYVDEVNDRIEVWETDGDLMVNDRFNWDYHVELVKGDYLPDDIDDHQGALVTLSGSVGKNYYRYEFLGDGLEVALITVDNFEVKKKNSIPWEDSGETGIYQMMPPNCDSCKFAIFFCGYRQADYWNDIKQKYNYKKDKHNVCPDHIVVLYKGGSHNTGDIPNGTTDGSGNFTSGGAFECSRDNLKKAFEYVKKKMKALNCDPAEFQFHSTGHGGGYQGKNGQKPGHPDSLATGIRGGRLDNDNDEVNNRTNENDVIFWSRGSYDLDGDGTADIRVRMVPDPRDPSKQIKQVQQDKDGDGTFETTIGHDFNGDGRVSKADSAWAAPDLNKNGSTDEVGWEDTMQIDGGEVVTDDELRKHFQDLIDSTGLKKENSRAELAQCFSGSFMDDLASVTTVSTSACGKDEVSWSFRGANGYNIYEKYFIDSLAAGNTWTDAHNAAKDSAQKVLDNENKSQTGQISDNTECIEIKGPYKKANQICIWVRNVCGKTMRINPFINTHNFGIGASRLGTQRWDNLELKNGEFRELCINIPSDTGKYCFLGGVSYSEGGFQYKSDWLNNIRVEATIGSNSIPVSFEVGGNPDSNVEFVFLEFDPTMLPPGWEMQLSQQTVQIINNQPVMVEAVFIPPPTVAVGDIAHFRIDGWTESPTNPWVGYAEGEIEIVTELNEMRLEFPEGWSLGSLTGYPNNPNVDAVIPDAMAVFGFNQIEGYIPLEFFNPPLGFWVSMPMQREYMFEGEPIENYTIELPQGWSIIGGLTEKPAIPMPMGSCEIEALFCFDPIMGYQPCEAIKPGQAAWINLSAPCQISVEATSLLMQPAKNANRWETTLTARGEKNGNAIAVSNAVIGADSIGAISVPAPPTPPEYSTDIKVFNFDSTGKPVAPGLYMSIHRETMQKDTLRWIVQTDPNGNDPFSPRTTVVKWNSMDLDAGKKNQKWIIVPGLVSEGIGTVQTDMKSTDSLVISGTSPVFHTVISYYETPNSVESRDADNSLVSISSVIPNPFSASADIRFELSQTAEIEIIIYDFYGREIWQHNAGRHEPGVSGVVWNGFSDKGTSLSNGSYYVKIIADTGGSTSYDVKMINRMK